MRRTRSYFARHILTAIFLAATYPAIAQPAQLRNPRTHRTPPAKAALR